MPMDCVVCSGNSHSRVEYRATRRQKRPAQFMKAENSAIPLRMRMAQRSITQISSSHVLSATARRRPARSQRRGTAVLFSIQVQMEPCCPSCTLTVTRSPTPPSSAGCPMMKSSMRLPCPRRGLAQPHRETSDRSCSCPDRTGTRSSPEEKPQWRGPAAPSALRAAYPVSSPSAAGHQVMTRSLRGQGG